MSDVVLLMKRSHYNILDKDLNFEPEIRMGASLLQIHSDIPEAQFLCFKFPLNPLRLTLTTKTDTKKRGAIFQIID